MADNENQSTGPATVTTDKSDYSPGETAIINTTGFDAGSTVQMAVQIVDIGADGEVGTSDDTLGEAVTWTVTDGGAGDLDGVANGGVTTDFHVTPNYAYTNILLTATQGQAGTDGSFDASGPAATHYFTDLAGPHIAVTKVAHLVDLDGDNKADAGETINYDITVTNTGTIRLDNVHVTDPFTGDPVGSVTLAGSPPPGNGPFQSFTFHTSHVVTQSDIDGHGAGAGHGVNSILNTATGFGSPNGVGSISATASDSTPIDYTPGISILKTQTSVTDTNHNGLTDAGDVINYNVAVTNTGTVTLTGVDVTDPLGDGTTLVTGDTINVGQTKNYGASHTLTQAEMDSHGAASDGTADNQQHNTATAKATEAGPVSSSVDTPIDYAPGISILKTQTSITDTNGNHITDAGDVINYNVAVTNSGDITLHNVSVTDPLGDSTTLATGVTLNVGQTQNYGASHTLTQAEIDSHGAATDGTADNQQHNTATAQANEAGPVSSSVDTPIDYAPGISILKTQTSITDTNGNHITDAGDVINYNVAVSNTGDVTLTGVSVTDPLGDSTTLATGVTLNVGQTQNYGASHTLTQAEIDSHGAATDGTADGQQHNTATAQANEAGPVSSSVDTPLDYTPGISILKTQTSITDTNGNHITDAGDVINYNVAVSNTGDVTLTGVSVTDPLGESTTLATGVTLNVGQTQNYGASHTLTQAEIDSHGAATDGTADNQQHNTATATSNEAGPVSSSVDTPIDYTPGISILKTQTSITDTNHNGKTDAGDVINYNVAVSNTGDVTLTGVNVTDPLGDNTTLATGVTLNVGQTQNYGASHTLTQAEIDSHGAATDGTADGQQHNTATATSNEAGPVSSSVDTPIDYAPGISILKTQTSVTDTNHNGKTDAGDVINYNVAVSNTGDVTLTGVNVTDPLGNSTTLATGVTINVGETKNYGASHTLTQAEIDSHGAATDGTADNKQRNTATAQANEAGPVSSSVDTPIDYAPDLSILKTVGSITDTNCNGKNDAGDVINYVIKVTNTGDVTLHHVVITDSLTGATVTPVGGITLNVGASQTYTTQHYTITAADIANKGAIDGTADKALTNTATADSDETGPTSSSVTTSIASNSGIAIDKTVTCVADNDCDGLTDAGDVITYNIKVTNTGSVVLTGVTVVDPLTGGTVASNVTLGVGKSVNYTKTYTIKQSDMDNNGNPAGSGNIVNTASVTDAQGDSASDTVSTDIDVVSKLSILKTVASITDTNKNGKTDAGDVINYAIKVTNTGNAALHHVVVTDSLTNATVTPTGGITLAAGASTTYTTQHYTITAADMANKGAIDGTADKALTNTATVDSDETGPASSSVTTALAFSGISIAKTVTCVTDKDCDGLTDAGDVITYNIKVTNTGNVALTGISVLDPMTGGTVASGVSLAIGASVNYTRTYTIKQADMDNIGNPAGSGDIVNTATVTDAQGDSASSSVKTDLDVRSGIDIQKLVSVDGGVNWYFTKSGSSDNFTVAQMSTMTGIAAAKLHIGTPTIDAGSTVQFKVVVTNTGNVTDKNIPVTDAAADTPELNGVNFKFAGSTTIASLAPGASKVSDALSAVAQTGTHTDVATVNGTYGTANATLASTNDMVAYTGKFTASASSHTADWWAGHHSLGCNDNQWHVATYNGQTGILLGDYAGTAWYGSGSASSPKALTSIASGMLFISDAAATDILAGANSSTDTRLVLAAQAIAAQLNINNGVDDAGYMPGTNPAGHDLIGEAVKWLTGQGPFTYADGSSGKIDTNGDRVLSAGNSNSYEFNTATGQFTSAAQSFSKNEWNTAVDVINTTPKAGDIMITGQELKNALASFNANGLQLVTSMAGTQVGWDNASLGAIDVVQNKPDAFWAVLAEHGVIAGTTYTPPAAPLANPSSPRTV